MVKIDNQLNFCSHSYFQMISIFLMLKISMGSLEMFWLRFVLHQLKNADEHSGFILCYFILFFYYHSFLILFIFTLHWMVFVYFIPFYEYLSTCDFAMPWFMHHFFLFLSFGMFSNSNRRILSSYLLHSYFRNFHTCWLIKQKFDLQI